MADMQAKRAYATVIAMMDNDNLKYSRDDENLRIDLGFDTDDLEVKIKFVIDEERELVRIFSFLPFKFSEDKRVEGAIATCVANHGMVNGSFDYDFTDGEILFKLVNSYKGDCFSVEAASYMLSVAVSTVDNYNDRFFALAKGLMSLSDFVDKENA